jgi:flagellar biosynthesis/type III secretory pathway chaperone
LTDTTEQANELARQLSDILEQEFEALRVQDLDKFEGLQPIKNELLNELTRLAPPAH